MSSGNSQRLCRAATLRHLRGILEQKSAEHRDEFFERRLPTGIPGVDSLLQGGFLRGSLAMISGSWASGKTSFALSPLIRLSRERHRAAIVDVAGCIFPPTLARMGADLERVLFVRSCRRKAVWAAEQILRSGIFHMVLLLDPVLDPQKSGGARLKLNAAALRRLQLASEVANASMIVVHPPRAHAGLARVCIQVEPCPTQPRDETRFLPRLSGKRQAHISVFRGAEAGTVMAEL